MTSMNDVRLAKESAEADLLRRPGVTAVGVGLKVVGGRKTDELSIRVFVEEKRDVPANQRIPPTINNVKTDVIQRRFAPLQRGIPLTDVRAMVDTGTYDPLQGGISIGPCRPVGQCIFVGTLGAIVTDNASGNPMLLSNFHVMCVDNNWNVGDTMAQPSRVDGGTCPNSVVGQLQRASIGGQVDCAVSSITARGHRCSIVDIGDVAGTATATINMPVRKRGRTTELTHGIVDTVNLTVQIDYDDPSCGIAGVGTVVFTNQIGIDVDTGQSAVFGRGGDSGSVVVNNGREVVGLYFAGSIEERDASGNITVPEGIYGIANPIQAVLNALNISICVPKQKPEIKEIVKEKPEFFEQKHRWKLEKFEIKELKLEKHEKLEIKEKVEIFEHKSPFREVPPLTPIDPVQPPFSPVPPVPPVPPVLPREPLSHFIRPELRPDLSLGALYGEPDLSSAELSALRQHLSDKRLYPETPWGWI